MAKKTANSAKSMLDDMFPSIPTSDDNDQSKPKTDDASTATTVAALQAQLAEMQKKLSENEQTNLALMTKPTSLQNQMPQVPVIDYSKAPDPIEDKEGYARFVADVNQQQADYRQAVAAYEGKQASVSTARLNKLWASFSETYPDYAENTRRVEIAAKAVVERALAEGLDADKYMYGTSGKFMRDVIEEMDDIFGKPSAVEAADDDDDEEEDDRSAGILGGGGSSASGGKTKPAAQLGSLSADIKEWQEKTGFSS